MKKKEFPTYEEAKKIVIENGIKSVKEYKSLCIKLGLPSNPNKIYRTKGWTNWISYLGEEIIIYPSYEEARRIVRANNIKSRTEYMLSYGNIGLMSNPARKYKNNGWKGWRAFLMFPNYEEAKIVVQEYGIKNYAEYKLFYEKMGLPSSPSDFYKNRDKGWIDWYDFLGKTKFLSSSERKFKVLTSLAINPILLRDDAPLQVIYMIASQLDKKLANEIEGLLNCTSCEDKLNWVKEQLKSLKPDTATISRTISGSATSELDAMESVMRVFKDSLDDLPEDTSTYINNILKNYYHNAINKELIAEYDE